MGRAAVAFAMEVEGPDSTVKQEGIDELDLVLAEVKAAGNLEGFVDVTRAKTWLREQGLRGSKLASKLGGLSSRRNRQAHPVLRQMVVEIRELGGEKSVDLPDRELGADKPLESCEPEQENDLGCPGPVRKNEKGNEVDTTRTDGGSEMQSVSESDHQGAKATAGTVGTKAGEVEQEQAVLEKGEEYTTTVVSGDRGSLGFYVDKYKKGLFVSTIVGLFQDEMQVGDLVRSVNGQKVESKAHYDLLTRCFTAGTEFVVVLFRRRNFDVQAFEAEHLAKALRWARSKD